MIKKIAIEVPDNVDAWEDMVRSYIDKHYPYLSDGISTVGFMKKEESTKDGIGEATYDHNGIQISIPIIIDDGNLLEPNLGIYKEQVVPISDEIFKWIKSNSQDFGQLINRDSQHIGQMDYLQQTGLFEEPDLGGYKSASLRHTVEDVRAIASQYPELEWLVDAINKTASFKDEELLIGEDITGNWGISNLNHIVGSIVSVGYDGIPKVATAISNKQAQDSLQEMPKATSPYQRVKFTHPHSDRYPMLKNAEESGGEKENKLVRIVTSDTFGSYVGVMGDSHGVTDSYKGRVEFDVKPLIEDKRRQMAMLIIDGPPEAADPEPSGIDEYASPKWRSEDKAIFGDIYGVETGIHSKKSEAGGYWSPSSKSYNMGDKIMIRMGKNSYSFPYIVDSKTSGVVGMNMEQVTVLSLMSILDYTKSDAIVCDVPELKSIRKSTVKDLQLKGMFRTSSPNVLMIPSGSIVRAPSEILFAADKGKMISDIIGGIPGTSMTMVTKVSGSEEAELYTIDYKSDTSYTTHSTKNEKIANLMVQYYLGDDTTAKQAAEEGPIPIEYTESKRAIDKIAKCVKENRSAFLEAAAKLKRTCSAHFTKVASVNNIVDGLIGVSFVDSSQEADTRKIAEQIMGLVSSLGNLIILARLGKITVPESALSRSFWSLAELLSKLRG